MAKTTPKVKSKWLYLNGSHTPLCSVGSADWFTWLETVTSFRYYTDQKIYVVPQYSRPMSPISVRKEKRRRGYLWYAYRRSNGQLYKRYVGKSEALTLAKLDEVANYLNVEVW